MDSLDIEDNMRGMDSLDIEDNMRGMDSLDIENDVRGMDSLDIEDNVRGMDSLDIENDVRGMDSLDIEDNRRGMDSRDIENGVRGQDNLPPLESAALAVYARQGSAPHGGLPVGALLVHKKDAHRVREALRRAAYDLHERWSPIVVSRAPGPKLPHRLLLHLGPAIAHLFETPGALPRHLADLVASAPAVYISGLRRHYERAPCGGATAASGRARFTFAEAFAGIGGFRLGLSSRLGGECVFANDVDAEAATTYRRNFGGDGAHLVEADLLDLPSESIPVHDLLTAGFPCQPFSSRGAQGGRCTEGGDWRGMLYLELVRVLRAKRPRAFLFENVVGLVVSDGGSRREAPNCASVFTPGRSFTAMLEAFAECGYEVSWRVVNARHWLPQLRERVFIVGLRIDLRVVGMDWSGLCYEGGTRGEYGDACNGGGAGQGGETVRAILEPAESAAVGAAELLQTQWQAVQEQCRARGCAISDREIPLDGKAPTLISGYRKVSNFASKYVFEEANGTRRVDNSADSVGVDGMDVLQRPRFLTARECARLMGFADTYEIRDEVRFYRQIGNAVCPPVVEAVAERVLRAVGV